MAYLSNSQQTETHHEFNQLKWRNGRGQKIIIIILSNISHKKTENKKTPDAYTNK